MELSPIVDEARAQIDSAADLASLAEIERSFTGKKGQLVGLKKTLGDLAPDERKAAGQALNQAMADVSAAAEARRSTLAASAEAEQLASERLDLTEVMTEVERGHAHLVTQARDRLEDVFVGMGFTVAEGPEVESAWYNFEALNIPEWHPARGSFDTIFVDLGEPEEVMLRSHTSPVQIRTMENQKPPIYIVAPGRTFRTDTADATHLLSLIHI